MHMLPFFVYGTLKPGGRNYTRYLGGRTAQEQPATLAGAVIFSPGPFPFLTREPDLVTPADTAHGFLMTVAAGHYAYALADLDGLEEYVPGRADNLYERIVAEVATPTGPCAAWVYVASPKALRLIRAGRLRRVLDGVWMEG